MMFKCKLCGSEVLYRNPYCSCSNSKCNMFPSWLYPDEWQKLNATWIPVAERLPEDEKPYLVKIQDTNEQYYDVWKYEPDDKFCIDHWKKSVISWMEIEE